MREPAAFAAWFRRIVLKRADRLRRGRFLDTVPLEHAADIRDANDPEAATEARELQRSIRAAVQTLGAAERLPLVLHYLVGYSQREIATMLDLQPNTVKQRLWQARRRLRRQLAAFGPPADAFRKELQFLLAVRIGDAATTQTFLDAEPALARARERWDDNTARRLGLPVAGSLTALHRAALDGHADVLRILIANGAEVNARTRIKHRCTWLYWPADYPSWLCCWRTEPIPTQFLALGCRRCTMPWFGDNEIVSSCCLPRADASLCAIVTVEQPKIGHFSKTPLSWRSY